MKRVPLRRAGISFKIPIRVLLSLHLTASPLLADGQEFKVTARASEIDSRTKEHPEIGFVFSKNGKPANTQLAMVDTSVPSSGRLVIWLMLGLQEFGPIVNVDDSNPPYENTRRLITSADVGNNPNRAHGASTPGSKSPKGKDGEYLYEEVWKYLYTHPVDEAARAGPDFHAWQRASGRVEKARARQARRNDQGIATHIPEMPSLKSPIFSVEPVETEHLRARKTRRDKSGDHPHIHPQSLHSGDF